MTMLSLSTQFVDQYLTNKLLVIPVSLSQAHQSLQNKTCLGADFLGWVDLPVTIQNSLDDIEATAQKIRGTSDVLIVC